MWDNRDRYGGGGDTGRQQKMWDDRDGEMGWKNGNRMGKY